jgi:hypothetical protein
MISGVLLEVSGEIFLGFDLTATELQPASPYRHILCLSDEAAVGILLPIPKLI